MVEIEREELDDLEKLGSGKFGTVYKKDDEIAYKIYFRTVADLCGIGHDNPSLNLSKRRFKKLIDISRQLKYTGGILDTIKIDGQFGGVVIPYYSGKTLDKMMDAPLELKVDISNQLVINCQELHRHCIYPIDFKLNNLIMDNDNVRIIDIDDIHTHVFSAPNPIYGIFSTNALSETIETFFEEYKHLYFPRGIRKQLQRQSYRFTTNHRSIRNYIDKKNQEKNIIFVDIETDLDTIKRLAANKEYKVVFVIPKMLSKKELSFILERFKNNGIDLYDFVMEDKIEDYLRIENATTDSKVYAKQKRD